MTDGELEEVLEIYFMKAAVKCYLTWGYMPIIEQFHHIESDFSSDEQGETQKEEAERFRDWYDGRSGFRHVWYATDNPRRDWPIHEVYRFGPAVYAYGGYYIRSGNLCESIGWKGFMTRFEFDETKYWYSKHRQEMILLHELGHVFGAKHTSSEKCEVMSINPVCDEFKEIEIDGLEYEYKTDYRHLEFNSESIENAKDWMNGQRCFSNWVNKSAIILQ